MFRKLTVSLFVLTLFVVETAVGVACPLRGRQGAGAPAAPQQRYVRSSATASAIATNGSTARSVARSGRNGPATARSEAHNGSHVETEADSRSPQEQGAMTFRGYAVCVKDQAGILWLADLLGDLDTANELVAALKGKGYTAWSAEYYRLNPRSTGYTMSNGDTAVGIAIQRGPGTSKAFAVGSGNAEKPSRVEGLGTVKLN